MREDTVEVLRRVNSDRMAVVSGEDDALFALLEMGGQGIITASGNIPEVARAYLTLMREHGAGNRSEAEKLQAGIMPLVRAVFSRKNPIPLGTFFNSPVFLPLVSVRETVGGAQQEEEIFRLIAESAPSLKEYHPSRF
jgi:4-hydroxy-tetrahydrodipicolinate synthase